MNNYEAPKLEPMFSNGDGVGTVSPQGIPVTVFVFRLVVGLLYVAVAISTAVVDNPAE